MSGGFLLFATVLAVALLLVLILRWKLHAFLALLLATIALGLLAGMGPLAILRSMEKGMADLLSAIALIIGAGAILGRVIEVSGGGEALARSLVSAFGASRVPWAILVAAYLIGIPVFFDAAFIALIPLVKSISSQAKRSLVLFAMPLLSALTATHGLIPLHPGTAAAMQLLGADPGRTVLYGLVLAIPMSIVGGIVWGGWIGRRMFVPGSVEPSRAPAGRARLLGTVAVVLLPVFLIALGEVFANVPWVRFFGSPSIAMLVAALTALVVLGYGSGASADVLLRHAGESLNSIGSLVLIIGASGAFKQVIVDSGAGAHFAETLLRAQLSPILLAYLAGAALRITLGSATASILTAAGLVAPIADAFPMANRPLLVMAVAAGGSILSHVNDAGFWMVKEYCGMTVPQTLRSYSVMKALTSLAGLVSLFALSLAV